MNYKNNAKEPLDACDFLQLPQIANIYLSNVRLWTVSFTDQVLKQDVKPSNP